MTFLFIFCVAVALFAIYLAVRGALAIAILIAVLDILVWYGVHLNR